MGMNLYIFEKIGKKLSSYNKGVHLKKQKSLYLCYTHKPRTNHAADHYNAIIDCDIPSMPLSSATSTSLTTSSSNSTQEDIAELKFTPPNITEVKDTPDGIAEVKYTPHNITEEKYTPMDIQSHDPVISLLEDSDDDLELEIIAEPPKQKKYKAKGQKSYPNLGLFRGVEPEIVDQMPWLVQGNRIFTIKCSEDYWHDKQLDGYHWKFTKSSHKGLMVLENLEHAKDILYVRTTNAQSILLNKFETPSTSRGTSRATHADHVDFMHTGSFVDM